MNNLDEIDIKSDDNPENVELGRDSNAVNRNTVGTFGFAKSCNKSKTISNPHN